MKPAVYIMANEPNGKIFVGAAPDLPKAVHDHRTGAILGYAWMYRCETLVYYKHYDHMPGAIKRCQELKNGSRARKLALIEADNPDWLDLYETVL